MKIKSFAGLNGIRFGMFRREMRELLGSEWKEFRKSPFSDTMTDAYDSLGLHLYYDKNDRLTFIEAFPPCEVEFDGIGLIGVSIDLVISQLKNHGYDGRYDEELWFFDEYGFAIINYEGMVSGVSVFSRGYYE